MQQLSVNLTIPIPSDKVLISKIELQELKQQQLIGVYWSMKDLETRINRKHEWIKENILYPTKFRKLLDVEMVGLSSIQKQRAKHGLFKHQKWLTFWRRIFTKYFLINNINQLLSKKK